jgi:hypothetical protein
VTPDESTNPTNKGEGHDRQIPSVGDDLELGHLGQGPGDACSIDVHDVMAALSEQPNGSRERRPRLATLPP